MAEKDKRTLCQGCRDDYYNHNRDGGCWGLPKAKVVRRTSVGTWQDPPYQWRPQRTLSCHTPDGQHWIDKDDPRIEKRKAKEKTNV